jgi:UDP-2,4-diacetamido-2,4,6-trideoxy-beta-L-altropyranose hydrolase
MIVVQRVVFRVDESSKYGFGHMSRCRVLAEALVRAGAHVCFYCRFIRPASRQAISLIGVKVVDLVNEQTFLGQDLRGSVVVVDGYHFDADFWQGLVSAGARRTVCIDDFREIPYRADIVVCYNEGVSAEHFDLAPHSRLFLGGRYLLLRPEILEAARLAEGPVPRRALMIAVGGTRQEPWVAVMLAHLSRIQPGIPLWVLSGRRLSTSKVLHQSGLSLAQVRFFSGLGAKGMIRRYRQARCLLVPASTLMLEAFSAGCPLVTGWIADNQRNSLDCYDKQGLVINVGDLRQLTLPALTVACTKARRQSGRMARRQRAYIRDSKSGIDEIVQAILAAA